MTTVVEQFSIGRSWSATLYFERIGNSMHYRIDMNGRVMDKEYDTREDALRDLRKFKAGLESLDEA